MKAKQERGAFNLKLAGREVPTRRAASTKGKGNERAGTKRAKALISQILNWLRRASA